MARTSARPGRTLVVFLLGTAIIFGLVALAGQWKPALGLDLQGGTRITLVAEGEPTEQSMNEARAIIDDRVNGSGVTESEVTQQGDKIIVVEIPGDSRRDLVDVVQRQAQLRFRLVACSDVDGRCAAGGQDQSIVVDPNAPSVTVPGETAPAAPAPAPEESGEPAAPSAPAESGGTGNNRPPVGFADGESPAPTESAEPTAPAATEPAASESATPSEGASPSEGESGVPATYDGPKAEDVEGLLAWQDSPDQASIDAFNAFTCPTDGTAVNVTDDPQRPLVSCEYDPESGQTIKYLMSAAAIEGTDLKDASAGVPQDSLNQWVVQLDIGGKGEDAFDLISQRLTGTQKQFAIVLDGQVLSAPTMTSRIPNGSAQITGNFDEQSSTQLATSLKYGALPIAFADDTSIETIGPSLAGDQLRAGLTAGVIGLALVLLYSMAYYRGLGTVVVASLVMAAALTYALVLLLSKTAGFTMTLPGIAGLIVAVGITADSFIILFERIRDEMRDGKSMRVAVEAGWVRARATCLAADAVSLLAAVVLYIFATGVVKGFAFALGISTLIDLAVFFWFTKPMVSWLARFRFFNSGHAMSGLSAETLGVDRLPAGGRA